MCIRDSPIIEEAIARCREARIYIMDQVMAPVISEPRKELSKYAPKIRQITIDPQKIGDVVGKQGKVINKIIEETGVKIDIEDTGAVSVCGTDAAMIEKAVNIINSIAVSYTHLDVYKRQGQHCILLCAVEV